MLVYSFQIVLLNYNEGIYRTATSESHALPTLEKTTPFIVVHVVHKRWLLAFSQWFCWLAKIKTLLGNSAKTVSDSAVSSDDLPDQ